MRQGTVSGVPATATQGGAIWDRWPWVEPGVWTERMLTALDEGVKGGVWFSLIDKVHPERTLRAAFSQVAANEGAAGVDHVTIEMFAEAFPKVMDMTPPQPHSGGLARLEARLRAMGRIK